MKTDPFQFATVPFAGERMIGQRQFYGKKVVAIPLKKLQEAKVDKKILLVIDKTKRRKKTKFLAYIDYMEFEGDEMPLSIGQFKDKWNRMDDYTLYYFIWKPQTQMTLF